MWPSSAGPRFKDIFGLSIERRDMNIKPLNSNILPIDLKTRAEAAAEVRSQAKTSGDRDADGKRQKQEEPEKRNLTEAEFAEAMEHLKSIEGLVANQLTVRVQVQGHMRIVFIEDPNGQVVRRLSESDLWTLTRDKDKPKGQILDRAM